MYFVVHWTLTGTATATEIAEVEEDLNTVLEQIASLQLLGGLAIARAKNAEAADAFVDNLIAVELLHDPLLDVAIFEVDSGSRYLVSEAVDVALALKIAGRKPDGQ